MTIFFDFEIVVSQEELFRICSGTRGKVLLELKAFLRERLSSLQEETNSKQDAYIMICAILSPKFQISDAGCEMELIIIKYQGHSDRRPTYALFVMKPSAKQVLTTAAK